ncbi:MAG TPA: PaaI family thioesterase [Terriglobales bacterium]|nr:PaaI family thioesterase [Terriglobales bacterium]
MSTIGAEMVSVGRGSVEIRFPFSTRLTQQNGFVHAGAVTSIMDSACGYAALSVAPEAADVLSVEFKVNLLAPGAGESFIARASVKRAGKRLTVCTADAFAVRAGEEKLIATMLATMMNMDLNANVAGLGD